jgi:hypothetical protein
MFNSFNRRQFMQFTVGAAIAAKCSDSLVFGGGAASEELLSHVDPLLRPRISVLPDSQNALPLLESASKLLTELPDGEFELADCFRSDKPDKERDRLISAWLDENQRVIPLVMQAVGRGKLEFPNSPWANERLDSSSRFRQLSRLLQLWAQRLASRDNFVNAAQISHTMSEASRLVKCGGGVYVEYLIACACESASWNLMTRIALHAKTNTKTVRDLLAQLPAREDSLNGLREAVRAEYCHYLLPLLQKCDGLDTAETIQVFFDWNEGLELFLPRKKYEAQCDKIARLLKGHPKPYDLVDTVKWSSAHYAGLIRDFDLSWPKHNAQPSRTASEELAAWPRQLSMSVLDHGDPDEVTDSQLTSSREKLSRVSNPLGKKVVDSCELDSKTMHRAALSNQARYDGTRLFLAICIFSREQGNFPANLEELVKVNILEKLPLDPFSSERFQYSRDQRAIWSVGWDGRVSPSAAADDDHDIENHLWRLDAIQP